MVPLINRKLTVDNFAERFRLQVILHRVLRWLLTSFKVAVHDQLSHLWAYYLEHTI